LADAEEADLFKLVQSRDIARIVESLLQDIRFGSIELVVHDGRVVQIEKREKIRLSNQA